MGYFHPFFFSPIPLLNGSILMLQSEAWHRLGWLWGRGACWHLTCRTIKVIIAGSRVETHSSREKCQHEALEFLRLNSYFQTKSSQLVPLVIFSSDSPTHLRFPWKAPKQLVAFFARLERQEENTDDMT